MRGTSVWRVALLAVLFMVLGHYLIPAQRFTISYNGEPVHGFATWGLAAGSVLLALLAESLVAMLLVLLLAGSSILLVMLILAPVLLIVLAVCLMLPLLIPGALIGVIVAIVVMRNKSQRQDRASRPQRL